MLPGVHVGLGLKWTWWNRHLTPKDCPLRTEKKLLTIFHFLSRLRKIKDHKQSLEVGDALWCFLLFQPLAGIFDKGQTSHLYIKGDYPESLSDENSSLCFEGKHFLLLCTCARARLLHKHGHCKSPSPLLNLQEQGPKVTSEEQWQYFVCVYWLTLHFFKTK